MAEWRARLAGLATPGLAVATLALVPLILAAIVLRDLASGIGPGFAVLALDAVQGWAAVWLVGPVAVEAHREALLGPPAAEAGFDYGAALVEARVLRWAWWTTVLVWGVLLPPDLLAIALGEVPAGGNPSVVAGRLVLALLAIRLLPGLAALAMDHPAVPVAETWRLERGRWGRTVLVCAAVVAPTAALYLTSHWAGMLLGGAPGALIRAAGAALALAAGSVVLARQAALVYRDLHTNPADRAA